MHDEFVSTTQYVKGLAEASIGGSDEFGFTHPKHHTAVRMYGADGNLWTNAIATAETTSRVILVPRKEIEIPFRLKDLLKRGLLPLNIKVFDIDIYDKGTMVAPKLPVRHSGWHDVEYRRSVSLETVWSLKNQGNVGVAAPNITSDPTSVFWRVRGNEVEEQRFEVNHPSTLSYTLTGLPSVDLLPGSGWLVDYKFKTETEINFIHFLGNTEDDAISDFGNTTGISAFRVFNEDGTDISDLFHFYDTATGRQLFTVPEPATFGLLTGPLALLMLRSRRRFN